VRNESVSPSQLPDWLLSRGRHFVTTAEVAELVGVDEPKVHLSLQRPREARKIVSVTKGGWVPVPPEYRQAGAPPPIHYIDPLMRHLDHPYYVGFLSSARIHGASHQVPMVFQVVTPALLRDRRIGASRVQFIRRAATADRPVLEHKVETGRVTVATPETTVLDIIEAPDLAAGLGNVGNVVGELVLEELVNGARLTDAAVDYPATVAQRAGWMIEFMAAEVGATVELDDLAELVAEREYTVLDPRAAADGRRDRRWRLCVNTEVEHDL
jgi:predicted transcriptional regulator of viral defense system